MKKSIVVGHHQCEFDNASSQIVSVICIFSSLETRTIRPNAVIFFNDGTIFPNSIHYSGKDTLFQFMSMNLKEINIHFAILYSVAVCSKNTKISLLIRMGNRSRECRNNSRLL